MIKLGEDFQSHINSINIHTIDFLHKIHNSKNKACEATGFYKQYIKVCGSLRQLLHKSFKNKLIMRRM